MVMMTAPNSLVHQKEGAQGEEEEEAGILIVERFSIVV